ncbi:MAG: hypothetical protein VKJ24_15375 [Synechococcales bacterium]|nr:hypothetical protein [Synechococcales bacterium]
MLPTTHTIKPLGLSLALLLSLLLTSCFGGKVTKENYEKIQAGMKVEDVEQILGKTEDQKGGGVNVGGLGLSAKTMTWRDDPKSDKSITIVVVNDQVTAKSQSGL